MKVDLQRLQKQSGIIGTSEKIYEVLDKEMKEFIHAIEIKIID